MSSLILNFLRRSSDRLDSSSPSVFCTTDLSAGASSFLVSASATLSVSCSRPTVTLWVSSLPLRMTTTSTVLPTGVSATMRGRSCISLTSWPSNVTTTSPASMPAGLAGPLSSMPATSAPCGGLMPRLSAMSSVTCWMRTPSQPRRVSPNWRSWSSTGTALSDGTAKPMPIEPPDGEIDRGVDADDFAVEVEQRAAGIAAIDGGVGLDVIVVGAGIDIAVARRDDAGGHRAAEAERIADGDHPFAEPQLVAVAELHRLERLVGMHAQAAPDRFSNPCRRVRP